MKLLDRYIAKNVLAAIALVTLMLSGVQIFLLFLEQLDTIGTSNYGIWQVALFVLLQMPYEVYLFFPMASMLGCLIGLSIMANHRELVVMRAAGMSIWQITRSILKVAFVVILMVTLLGETCVPTLSHLANNLKIQALNDGQALRTATGIWLRYQNDFISIDSIVSGNELFQVDQFKFDEGHHLRIARHIERVKYDKPGVWQAYGIAETLIQDGRTEVRHVDEMPWDVSLKPTILSVGSTEPDEMTLHELHQYLSAQKSNHQAALNYQLAYLQRLVQPLTTVVMMLLAIPFIFGPLRSSTMGSKLLAGATVGFGFYIMNRFFGPISQVFQWPPEVAAFGPTCLFAMLGLYLMRRVK